MRNPYKISVGRPEVMRPLGKPRSRQKDNINMDLNDRVVYVDKLTKLRNFILVRCLTIQVW